METQVRTEIEPFLRFEPEAAPRLEPLPVALPPPVPLRRTRLPVVLIGIAVLALGFPALWAAWLVSVLFDHAAWLGWTGLAIVLAGFGLVGWGLASELRGLATLRRVDRLRADLASGETERVVAAARQWVEGLPQHANLVPAITAAGTPETVLSLLQAGPGAELAEAVDALGRNAAIQAGAIVAATPSPALDVLAIGWRGLRLVRQVAALHGLRPGLTGTLALLQRTANAAASVAATQLAVNAAAHAVVSHPFLRHVLGDVAGAGVAARRMIVLARAASSACTPLP
jgi:putative membrane protein